MHLNQVSLTNICSGSSGGLDLILHCEGFCFQSFQTFQSIPLRGMGREAAVEDRGIKCCWVFIHCYQFARHVHQGLYTFVIFVFRLIRLLDNQTAFFCSSWDIFPLPLHFLLDLLFFQQVMTQPCTFLIFLVSCTWEPRSFGLCGKCPTKFYQFCSSPIFVRVSSQRVLLTLLNLKHLKVFFREIWGPEITLCLTPALEVCEFCGCLMTAGCFQSCISAQLTHAGHHQIQYHIPSPWPVYYLTKDVILDELQEFSGFLRTSYATFQAGGCW